jgi:hypothetical protein
MYFMLPTGVCVLLTFISRTRRQRPVKRNSLQMKWKMLSYVGAGLGI